jgi:hypothetical protein
MVGKHKLEIPISPDVRIIDEDDTHIVVAVRIEKARLKKNIHFFAALFDCASMVEPVA